MFEQPTTYVAEVIVNVPARGTDRVFDYLVPEAMSEQVCVGSRVVVPFGPRNVQGFVIRMRRTDEEPKQQLKQIKAVLDSYPPLTEELIELSIWMKEEYTCVHLMALQAMLPAVFKAKTEKVQLRDDRGVEQTKYIVRDKITHKTETVVQALITEEQWVAERDKLPTQARKQREIMTYVLSKGELIPLSILLQETQATRSSVRRLEERGWIRCERIRVERDPYGDHNFSPTKPLVLTPKQEQALQTVLEAVHQEKFETFLLHGVTGSGKTEIYLQAISVVLTQGKEAIVLVPEISLTPQMVERFKGRFGNQVAVLHSRLSAGERYDEWRKIREGRVKVAIGARSALFAPFQRLGLIIIDEEHESSYKQEEVPRYHARDIAMFRGQYHQAPVLLGSATPSLESYARAHKGVYRMIELDERVGGKELPTVHVIDMRQELQAGNRSMFSRYLYQKIVETLEKKEQMVLFLNRRGFSTFVMCRDCGYVMQCPHCDISLTYHKSDNTARCHYCGYTEKLVSSCPNCSSQHIRFFGTGTQKVEEELYQSFPGIRVIRMDVDTTRRKGSHERLLQQFKQGKADCLLGTQMIAKGLDFERVTLVGVVAADSILHLPDFRSSEKTFQLLTQVSGRAGRHQLPGEVVIQTYTPQHYSIRSAKNHDFATFYRYEMQHRRQHGYPPYFYLTLITLAHTDLTYVVKTAEQIVRWLKSRASANTLIMGPVASPIPRIKDRYRYQCVIKYRDEPNLNRMLSELVTMMQSHKEKNDLHVQIDKNPQFLM